MSSLEKPRCVDSKAYLNWLEAASVTWHRNNPQGDRYHAAPPFCRDCTPGYAEKMRRARLCDHPQVKFKIDEDGFVAGFISAPVKAPRLKKGDKMPRRQKKRISATMKGRRPSQSALDKAAKAKMKCVMATPIQEESGPLIFGSLTEASRRVNPNNPNGARARICNVLKGHGITAYGYTWRYVDAG